jgi:hypothetical protein
MDLRLPCVRVALVAVCIAVSPSASWSSEDPGLSLELDRERYEVVVRDERSGAHGPRIRVVMGSPAHDTPGGEYSVGRVILNPAWNPSEGALTSGAVKLPASLDGPMGVAKIPFADGGSIALHGGGDPLLLGKPVSGGCVRARDADLLRVIAWLHAHGALTPAVEQPDGEIHRSFRRPVRLRVR